MEITSGFSFPGHEIPSTARMSGVLCCARPGLSFPAIMPSENHLPSISMCQDHSCTADDNIGLCKRASLTAEFRSFVSVQAVLWHEMGRKAG
jgi:hypothetical protein